MTIPPRMDEPPAPPGWKEPALRWLELALRLAVLGLVARLALLLPLPLLDDWLPLKNVAVATLTVIIAGKLLFDTLFQDRFWP